MKILFLHPEDPLAEGPWVSMQWDAIVDLGRSGETCYREASSRCGCSVRPIDSFREGFAEIHKVRDLLGTGLGRVVDRYGLDWWELNAILTHTAIERLVLIRKVAATLRPADEIFVSRAGFYATALKSFLGSRLQTFVGKDDPTKRAVGHYYRVAKKFPTHKLIEIFWDKNDPGYQFRGRFARRTKRSPHPVVLAPTAYINASRTAIAYAKTVPDLNFLLVCTRQSGWMADTPANVTPSWLSSYASLSKPARRVEYGDLVQRWNALRVELEAYPELASLSAVGGMDDFPSRLAQGLEVRDAWLNVLDDEPVSAVLCPDDSNPYTHIPLLLANSRGMPTVACHHGALDGRYMFKRAHANVVLAKGLMEEDYLTRVCNVPRTKLEVGAPASTTTKMGTGKDERRKSIVFFSEAFEVSGGGRAKEFYRDVLPPLADLAIREGCELIVKLHPAESLAERKKFVVEVLSPAQRQFVRVVEGPLSNLLDSAWFGVTVLSTVAVECAMKGIPCFLCRWLEFWPYGYIDQFVRFGVAQSLDRPEDLSKIPTKLAGFTPNESIRRNFSIPIEVGRLETLLAGRARVTSSV